VGHTKNNENIPNWASAAKASHALSAKKDKNSSGDEIANVTFLRRYRTYFKILKKRTYFFEQIRQQLGKYCALSLEFMNLLQNFNLAVIEYLYRGRRAVPLQTFTTRHSNRKLSTVMALSTTFTQCASETTKFGKITQNKGHFAVQGHSRSPSLVPIESSYTTSFRIFWVSFHRHGEVCCR